MIWRCKPDGPVPSVADIRPSLSWYEREMSDLFGVAFVGQPEPHRLVLRTRGATAGAADEPRLSGRTGNAPRAERGSAAGDRQPRRAAAAIRAGAGGRRRVGRVHVRLCRRAHHSLSSASVLQAPRHGEALRGPRAGLRRDPRRTRVGGRAASLTHSPSAKRWSKPRNASFRRAL